MKQAFIIGKKVYLRGLEHSDLDGPYFQWLNDPEVTKYMVTGRFPNTKEKMEQFYSSVANSSNNVMLAIIEKKSDRHIGNIKLGPIDWIHQTAPLGIMIGDKTSWGKGYGTDATRICVKHAFDKLNLNRVYLGVLAIHKSAIKVYEKIGFKVEGCQRQHFYLDGQYYDALIMGILREDFKG